MVFNICLLFSDAWLRQLHQDLVHTQKKAFAKGTISNLKSQWNKFSQFMEKMDKPCVPISPIQLCLYIQFLSRSLRSPQSVRSYVSGLKVLHKFLDLPFPSYSDINVQLTFKGLDKSIAHIPHQAAPITPQILYHMFSILDFTDPVHLVFWTLFLFARKSQFIPNSTSQSSLVHLVKQSQVRFINGLLQVTFTWTKTRQSGGIPLIIPLVSIPESPLCPVTAYLSMVAAIPAPSQSPAFVLPLKGKLVPIVYSVFHKVLRACISQIGGKPKDYSSHSFRRGGATYAFSTGVRGEMIQTQGDWVSDAYKRYLEFDYDTRVKVAQKMATSL